MKTVLQQMLNDVEYAKKNPNISPLTLKIYESIKNMILKGIPLEKQQIINAYIEASAKLEDITKEAAENYYEKTYK